AEWRSHRGTSDAQGHVVSLGNDRFLCTHGARGLKVYQANERAWTLQSSPPELKDRLVGPPLVLPHGNSNGAVDVCIADSAGLVSLLTVDKNGSLRKKRAWKVSGQITSGPFLRTQDNTPPIGGATGVTFPAIRGVLQEQGEVPRIGCIVEQKR